LISVIIPAREAGEFLELVRRVGEVLGAGAGRAGVTHEIIAVYGEDADALEAADAMPERPRTLRLVRGVEGRGVLGAGAKGASGDVVAVVYRERELEVVRELAGVLRREGCAMAIARSPQGERLAGLVEFLLGAVAGMGAWNMLTGMRVYAGAFLDGQEIEGRGGAMGERLELAVKGQLDHVGVVAVKLRGAMREAGSAGTEGVEWREMGRWLREALWAPAAVYGLWGVMLLAGVAITVVRHGWRVGIVANVVLPGAAVFALTLAVRRVRGRVRLADAFFSLVLLDPLLVARTAVPWDKRLVGAGLLGLMAGAIIAMKRDRLGRYVAVVGLALGLTWLSETFAMLLPALVAWLAWVGFGLAKKPGRDWATVRGRTHGYVILAAAECGLVVFGLACILAEPTPPPMPATLLRAIVSFAEFPLLVGAILMLALGWRPGRRGVAGEEKTPPYFWGMLALLVGLLTMLVNNFQGGALPPPGADQTVMIVCLVYTVSALHGPRRLQWVMPPLLLAAAGAFMAARWHG
jgi:hypothetical protein